ncbi:MAG: hypothetical protein HYV34_05000, partial [Candidatus Kerfeldbacteria bacterium]|nr:hypothetical protein [Candidatus Kerfeldbacteria bacterium]
GWLRRVKRGLYLVIDSLTSRSRNDLSLGTIANALMEDSYVSLTYALNDYHLFDQFGKTVVSITPRANARYRFDGITFQFSKVKKEMYFGFTEKLEGGKTIRIAHAEKALIDFLYLDKRFRSASLVFEILRDHSHDLDLNMLQDFALRTGITVQRKIGFLLDALHLDSTRLASSVKKNRSVSRFTRDSRSFNSKWRIYYDDRIIG